MKNKSEPVSIIGKNTSLVDMEGLSYILIPTLSGFRGRWNESIPINLDCSYLRTLFILIPLLQKTKILSQR